MPFETIALDFITKLPESQGCDTILTITDHDCSKAAIFIPCREEITAEETAGLFVQHVFPRFGLPTKIISDRDPRFASKFTREACKLLGIEQNISMAYHPWCYVACTTSVQLGLKEVVNNLANVERIHVPSKGITRNASLRLEGQGKEYDMTRDSASALKM